MRSIHALLNEYGESHQNETNKLIHWICVPSIVFSLIGLLYCVKLPFFIQTHQLNLAFIVVLLAVIYYSILSIPLSVGMVIFVGVCLFFCHLIEKSGIMPLWLFSVIVFVAAWLGQFYGHKIEGKKPSFLKDVQFLLIGPAWLMSFIYKKLGIAI
jgi:uncharacterized membrane protein YGL010W